MASRDRHDELKERRCSAATPLGPPFRSQEVRVLLKLRARRCKYMARRNCIFLLLAGRAIYSGGLRWEHLNKFNLLSLLTEQGSCQTFDISQLNLAEANFLLSCLKQLAFNFYLALQLLRVGLPPSLPPMTRV